MSSKSEAMASVLDAFKARGFRYVSTEASGWVRLSGALHAEAVAHPCQISLDPNFIEFPLIRLTQIPQALQPVAPHINSVGGLCYLAKGTVVLNIFDPVGQMLACLMRAEQVLGQLLRKELVRDLEEEFFAYWGGLLCFVDLQGSKLGRQTAVLASPHGYPIPVVTDDETRTQKKLKELGWPTKGLAVPVVRIRTKSKPRPTQNSWPPKTLRDILRWQGLLDPLCRRKIEKRVREAASQKVGGLVLLIESPLLTYGMFVDFDTEITSTNKLPTFNKAPFLFDSHVTPMDVMRIDDRYLAERNVPGKKTLGGKRIVLIGCGTIGGFLADLLTKMGAGTSGGQLTLVDKEVLLPGNVGRHRLGFPGLLQNKAKALAQELVRAAPGANVNALPVDVQSAHLGEMDLLIDATGEEPLSNWLTSRYGSKTAMLSVWIEGPGTAVRGLLRPNVTHACFHCLCVHVKNGLHKPVEGERPIIFAGQGCEGLYVPFPATVSLQAACLGTEMVQDWVSGAEGPLLRTIVTDRTQARASDDCNPQRLSECPACST